MKKQLPKYLKIDACKNGIFLVIVYNDKDIKRINNIQDIARETAEYYKVSIKIMKMKFPAKKLQGILYGEFKKLLQVAASFYRPYPKRKMYY